MMNLKKKSAFVWDHLSRLYPDAACTLDSDELPFHFFVRGILSAQCTDKRVNAVAEELFVKYPDTESFAAADEAILGEEIKSCGLYKAKAKGIIGSANLLLENYGGVIPKEQEVLQTFPSVGRKIANLIAGEIYGIPAIVVDTHCGRVARRLGFSKSETPTVVEKDLCRYFPKEQWIALGHLMVAHGRERCMARNPNCKDCPMSEECVYASKEKAD